MILLYNVLPLSISQSLSFFNTSSTSEPIKRKGRKKISPTPNSKGQKKIKTTHKQRQKRFFKGEAFRKPKREVVVVVNSKSRSLYHTLHYKFSLSTSLLNQFLAASCEDSIVYNCSSTMEKEKTRVRKD